MGFIIYALLTTFPLVVMIGVAKNIRKRDVYLEDVCNNCSI